ncbi:MAG: hypothetical protein ACRDHF_05410, partial [Tepidiformaceae bacterium]
LVAVFYAPPLPPVGAPHPAPWDSLFTISVLLVAISSGVIVVLVPKVTSRLRWLAGVSLLLLLPGLVFYQRYSILGVHVLGGGHHWVRRAAEERSDDNAALCLRRMLGVSQYGLNVAERAVLRLDDRAQRARLFMLLAQLVPWQNWQERYEHHAREAVASSGD